MAGLEKQFEPITFDESEEDLMMKVRARFDAARSARGLKEREWKEADRYYSNETVNADRAPYLSDTRINLIFANYRNLVGLLTDNRPAFLVDPEPTSVQAQIQARRDKAKISQSTLEGIWDSREMQIKITHALYPTLIYGDCFGMWFWNTELDDIDFMVILPQDLYIDPAATSVYNANYVVRRCYMSPEEAQEMFPKSKSKIEYVKVNKTVSRYDNDANDGNVNKVNYTEISEGSESDGIQMAKIYEFWTPYKVVYCSDNWKHLKTKPNPYFNFSGYADEKEELDKEEKPLGERIVGGIKKLIGKDKQPDEKGSVEEKIEEEKPEEEQDKNFLDHPTMPFVQFESYKLPGELYSRSLTMQVKYIQDTINRRKQQIDDALNAAKTSGITLEKGAMSPAEVNKITNEPGEVLEVNDITKVKREIPNPGISPEWMDDLRHSENMMDHLIGQHDISRGATQSRQPAQTATILREADQVSVRLVSRNLERSIVSIVQGWLQLIKLFYTEKRFVKVLGKEETMEFVRISQEDIMSGSDIRVKPSSTLPKDKVTRQDQATQAYNSGNLDPLTWAETMEYPNPKQFANRVANWTVNRTISDEPVAPPEQGQPVEGEGRPPQQEEGQVEGEQQQITEADAENQAVSQSDNPDIEVRDEDNHEEHITMHMQLVEALDKSIQEMQKELEKAKDENDAASVDAELQEAMARISLLNEHVEDHRARMQGGQPPPQQQQQQQQ